MSNSRHQETCCFLFLSLFAGNDEVQSIQNQLNSLKLNPYREVKVVNDGEEASAPPGSALPVADSSNSNNVLRAKDISGQLSDIELSQTRVIDQAAGAFAGSAAAAAVTATARQ